MWASQKDFLQEVFVLARKLQLQIIPTSFPAKPFLMQEIVMHVDIILKT